MSDGKIICLLGDNSTCTAQYLKWGRKTNINVEYGFNNYIRFSAPQGILLWFIIIRIFLYFLYHPPKVKTVNRHGYGKGELLRVAE